MSQLPDPNALRTAVDAHIARLRRLAEKNNPLELLSRVALHHLLVPENGAAPHQQSEAQVEYLLSLFLAAPFPAGSVTPTPAVIQECLDQLAEFHGQATVYYALNSKAKSGAEHETEMILLQRLQTLHVRGDAYFKHYRQTYEGIAGSHDEFLRRHYGFSAQEFWETLESIHHRVQDSIGEAFAKLQPLLEDPDKAQAAIDQFGGPAVFAVAPLDPREEVIFRELSLGFGDNAAFWNQIPAWRGWPMNPTLVPERPLVRHEDKYYAFHLPLLLRQGLVLVEALIRRADAGYWQNTFLQRRDDYVEAEAVRLISGMLPGCQSFSNLYYHYAEAGETRRAELDGLIVYDDCLLVVEVKASGLSDAARRGAPDSLRTDLTASLDKAYAQAQRVLTVVRSTDEVTFTDETGTEVVRLRFAEFRRFFLVSVTREHFAALATQLHIVRKLGLIQGAEWPWAVSLDDLRVISEMMEFGIVFLQYLTRRVAVNQHEKLATIDEIDLLGLFFENGLYPEALPRFEEGTMVMLTGFSDRFDDYYRGLARARTAEKPRLPIPQRLRRLLGTLEKFRPRHFTSAGLHILAFDSVLHEQLEQGIPRAEKGLSKNRETLCVMGNDKVPAAPIVILGCAGEGTELEARLNARAKEHKAKRGAEAGVFIVWQPPLTSGKLRVHLL